VEEVVLPVELELDVGTPEPELILTFAFIRRRFELLFVLATVEAGCSML
jgi:hypothetical protein